ncbi:nucleoredoxin [Aplysia californica]|uniref:Nucleoredoxin n=1 Tax=Aplysia californica TaxID=6500 RepID=A0ABM0JPC4_APLCA|nr:nucleoredoxin [Aplysia californica]
MALEGLFGSELVGKHDTTVAVSSLSEKELIGVYFSAHWCPPCRSFTPKLVDTYVKVRDASKKWEIVFVSFDRTLEACNEYYLEMPWLMLPFDSDLKEGLAEKFKVEGIPALIFLDPKTGEVKSMGGRALVEDDKEGAKFPWV